MFVSALRWPCGRYPPCVLTWHPPWGREAHLNQSSACLFVVDRNIVIRVCVSSCCDDLIGVWPRRSLKSACCRLCGKATPVFPRQSRHNVVPLSGIVHPTFKCYARVHACVRTAPCVTSLVRLTCVCVYQGWLHSRSLAGTVTKILLCVFCFQG